MEFKIIEEKKTRIVFSLKGEDHTFCNALKDELWNDKSVKIASYRIEHPLLGTPIVTVETDGQETPQAAVKKAVKRIGKTFEKMNENVIKEL